MNDEIVDNVYYSLLGEQIPEAALPWVENAFAKGSSCDLAYQEMLAAYERLRKRLGVEEEDEDTEIIIGSMLEIQRLLCLKMFELGCKYQAGQ